MAKDKESFRDELEKLAKIADIIDDSILSTGDVNVVVEMNEKDYKYILKNFAQIYQNLEEMVIDISGVNFKFVLKK
jgi:hypothetical protein